MKPPNVNTGHRRRGSTSRLRQAMGVRSNRPEYRRIRRRDPGRDTQPLEDHPGRCRPGYYRPASGPRDHQNPALTLTHDPFLLSAPYRPPSRPRD